MHRTHFARETHGKRRRPSLQAADLAGLGHRTLDAVKNPDLEKSVLDLDPLALLLRCREARLRRLEALEERLAFNPSIEDSPVRKPEEGLGEANRHEAAPFEQIVIVVGPALTEAQVTPRES